MRHMRQKPLGLSRCRGFDLFNLGNLIMVRPRSGDRTQTYLIPHTIPVAPRSFTD